MRAGVLRHVNQFERFARARERRFGHGLRLARQRNHATVVVRVHFPVQDVHARHAAHRLHQGINLGRVASL
jgi:hypothetical protein